VARKVLGQGLRALIPDDSKLREARDTESGLRLIPIELVAANPMQPRKRFDDAAIEELAESIRQQGILQPLVVRRAGSEYEIVVGERRFRAAVAAGLKEIPALVRDSLTDGQMLELALVENIQREDLDPIDEAKAYRDLMDRAELTQQKLAERIGKSREAVANSLRLLKLPRDIQELIATGALSSGHGRALLAVSSDVRKHQLTAAALKRGLSVRELERMASRKKSKRNSSRRDPDVEALELRLEEYLSARVHVRHSGSKGRVEIFYESLEELDRIVAILKQ